MFRYIHIFNQILLLLFTTVVYIISIFYHLKNQFSIWNEERYPFTFESLEQPEKLKCCKFNKMLKFNIIDKVLVRAEFDVFILSIYKTLYSNVIYVNCICCVCRAILHFTTLHSEWREFCTFIWPIENTRYM